MPEAKSFAYSLSQDEEGWRWKVYDEDGITVSSGAHSSRTAAQAAVEHTLKSAATLDPGSSA